jgi:pyruvate dehydrogenase E1 component alpha subunit
MGTTAIVGNSIPIGVGLGLSCKLDGGNQVACIFLGDGAVEEGVFYEAVNFSAVKKLPVLFICENNLYSVYSPLHVRQPKGRNIFEMVEAIGVTSSSGNGNDALETYNLIDNSVSCIREGSGPQFIELSTYRWREHCGPNYDNDLEYRSEDEFLKWKDIDPIATLYSDLIDRGVINEQDQESAKRKIADEIKDAFKFAEDSPFPDASESYADEYFLN